MRAASNGKDRDVIGPIGNKGVPQPTQNAPRQKREDFLLRDTYKNCCFSGRTGQRIPILQNEHRNPLNKQTTKQQQTLGKEEFYL